MALRFVLGAGGILALLPAGLFPAAVWTDAIGVGVFVIVYALLLRRSPRSGPAQAMGMIREE